MKTPVHKIELYVVEPNDSYGIEEVKLLIDYSLEDKLVIFGECKTVDAGEWHDDHKLNFSDKNLQEARKLFQPLLA